MLFGLLNNLEIALLLIISALLLATFPVWNWKRPFSVRSFPILSFLFLKFLPLVPLVTWKLWYSKLSIFFLFSLLQAELTIENNFGKVPFLLEKIVSPHCSLSNIRIGKRKMLIDNSTTTPIFNINEGSIFPMIVTQARPHTIIRSPPQPIIPPSSDLLVRHRQQFIPFPFISIIFRVLFFEIHALRKVFFPNFRMNLDSFILLTSSFFLWVARAIVFPELGCLANVVMLQFFERAFRKFSIFYVEFLGVKGESIVVSLKHFFSWGVQVRFLLRLRRSFFCRLEGFWYWVEHVCDLWWIFYLFGRGELWMVDGLEEILIVTFSFFEAHSFV